MFNSMKTSCLSILKKKIKFAIQELLHIEHVELLLVKIYIYKFPALLTVTLFNFNTFFMDASEL